MADADASLQLQRAIIERLKVDAAVVAIVGTKVFDVVPAGTAKPYISFGPTQALPDKADEYDGSDIFQQIDAWSDAPNRKPILELGAAIRAALDEQPLTLTDNQRLVRLSIEQTNYLTEPDGLTRHAALTFRARTEPAS